MSRLKASESETKDLITLLLFLKDNEKMPYRRRFELLFNAVVNLLVGHGFENELLTFEEKIARRQEPSEKHHQNNIFQGGEI